MADEKKFSEEELNDTESDEALKENDTACEEEAEDTAEAAEAEDTKEEGFKETGKASPFRKKPKKDKRDEQIESLKDQLKRNLAEFENFRKRSEKEKSGMFDMGVRSVAEKLLPIIDNFERGIAMRSEDESTAFAEGMDKVYRQFRELLEQLGITPIEAVGRQFDPNFHNAVMQDEESDAEAGTVVEEFQKGYMYRDTVIRYSMVKVKA